MAITPMDKQKAVRGSLIDAVDKINELITAVNLLDPQSIEDIEDDIAALQASDTTMSGRIDALAQRMTTNETLDATQQSDIDAIKITLYTPLSSGENPSSGNSSGNGGN